ncbi:hypothetical protein H0A36_13865 [Endozoicomonas sp. SM1973]|uniref:Uncharacterized protein n=1 Tax=Spartinivicinus marinus TaxID=2994442 RepID=A0A853I660_9GAMM|nr:hypothetical protein [Spartinivicinus marinus]MCX4028631.1 hypothetical protein [Spartinivicinus marinus]NYZ67102.1 hypothetical protein [Spartinivicinus marinus]
MTWHNNFSDQKIHKDDPNPWLALYLDNSLPMHKSAKRALLQGQNSGSRRLLLPIIRPFARLMIIVVQLLRMIIPSKWSSSKVLHYTIYWGLKHFVKKDANYLILRHFNIGTELLQFIADNTGITIESTIPLRPKKLEDLKDDTFLIHDLNVYNFIAELNQKLTDAGREFEAPEVINYDAITDDEFDIDPGKQGIMNIIDLQTAVEAYTPLYALLLSDHDFWRASNSLQLDETFAIYISKLMRDPLAVTLVSNRHPTVPFSTLQAGFRLMLHGLDAEILHGYLREQKQKAGNPS